MKHCKTVAIIILLVTTLLVSLGVIKLYNTNRQLKIQVEELQNEVDHLTKENDRLNSIIDQQNANDNIESNEEVKYITETKHAVITYYAELPNDMTDGTTTSSGKHVEDGMIGAPNEYAFGTQIIINGKTYTVEDRGGYIKTLDNGDIRLNIFIPRNENESDEEYKQRVLNMGVTESDVQIIVGEEKVENSVANVDTEEPAISSDEDHLLSKVTSNFAIAEEDYFEFEEEPVLDDVEYDYNEGEITTVVNPNETEEGIVDDTEVAVYNENYSDDVYYDDSQYADEYVEDWPVAEAEEENKAMTYLKYIIAVVLVILLIIFLTTSSKPQNPDDNDRQLPPGDHKDDSGDNTEYNNGNDNYNGPTDYYEDITDTEYNDSNVEYEDVVENTENTENQDPELEFSEGLDSIVNTEVVDDDSNILIDDNYYDRLSDNINKMTKQLIDKEKQVNDIGIQDDFNINLSDCNFDFETQEFKY